MPELVAGVTMLRKVLCPMPGCPIKPVVPCTWTGDRWTISLAVLRTHLGEHEDSEAVGSYP